LDCSRNEIKNLDNLPPNLQILHCGNNSIKYISKFPDSIKIEKELISEYEMRKNMDYGIIKDDDIEGYLPNDYEMKIKNLIDEGMI
jgi:Leucine-rich repeat (LRR) protein